MGTAPADFYNEGTVSSSPGTIPAFNVNLDSLGGNFQPAANAAIVGHLSGTFSGTLNWSGGQVSGQTLTVASNAVLNIVGSVNLYASLINNGTVNWQSGFW